MVLEHRFHRNQQSLTHPMFLLHFVLLRVCFVINVLSHTPRASGFLLGFLFLCPFVGPGPPSPAQAGGAAHGGNPFRILVSIGDRKGVQGKHASRRGRFRLPLGELREQSQRAPQQMAGVGGPHSGRG